MPIQKEWTIKALQVVCLVTISIHRFDCGQSQFMVLASQKVVSGVTQLASFSKPEMSSILCAASCESDSYCDLYHYSNKTNVCATFSQGTSFDPFVDLIRDPDWSVGIEQQLSFVKFGVWTLVFRAQSKIGVPVYETWVNSLQQDDNPVPRDFPHACLRLTDYSQCDRHFRSHTLDYWSSYDVQEVRYSLVKDDNEVAYLLFDGVGSDMLSWFSDGRLLESHWSPTLDLDTDLEPVSIEGSCDAYSCRRFLIHQTYGLCRYEYFYTFVIDMAFDTCNTGTLNWEVFNLTSFPVFVYAPGTGPGSFGIDRGNYEYGQEADVMSVWVKFF